MSNERLLERGQTIIEMARNNPLHAGIAEGSLKNILLMLNGQDGDYGDTEHSNIIHDSNDIPPQICQTNMNAPQMMGMPANQPSIFGQSLLMPMMGNQMNSRNFPTNNIPFLYHQ